MVAILANSLGCSETEPNENHAVEPFIFLVNSTAIRRIIDTPIQYW